MQQKDSLQILNHYSIVGNQIYYATAKKFI